MKLSLKKVKCIYMANYSVLRAEFYATLWKKQQTGREEIPCP